MNYVILYFSIGFVLALIAYLYSCYDYKTIYKTNSYWDEYVQNNDTYSLILATMFVYPLILLILLCVGLRWCFFYITEHTREYIFEIIDKHFIK